MSAGPGPDKPLSLKDCVRSLHWVAASWAVANPFLAIEMRRLADWANRLADRAEDELKRLG